MNNREIATKILGALNEKGAGLGNASTIFIEKVLDYDCGPTIPRHIFVTIAEFISEGGELKKDREFFTAERERGFTEYRIAGYYKENSGGMLLGYNASMKSFPISTIAFYVKVAVNPIWK